MIGTALSRTQLKNVRRVCGETSGAKAAIFFVLRSMTLIYRLILEQISPIFDFLRQQFMLYFNIMNISFITIHLSTIEPSLSFYRDTLGLKIVRDFNPTDFMRIVFLQGEGTGQIELIENKKLPAPLDHTTCPHVTIGIRVTDVQSTHQKLVDQKVTIIRSFLSPERGPKMFYILDPNGVEISFIQE